MTGTLFRRLLVLALLLVALTVWAVDSTIAGYLSRQETEAGGQRLTAEARNSFRRIRNYHKTPGHLRQYFLAQ